MLPGSSQHDGATTFTDASLSTDVRGVSGGERKRVSIAEVLTNRATVQAWDNATRGLDANTALQAAQIMRTLTDVNQNSTIVSLYQAGNAIYRVSARSERITFSTTDNHSLRRQQFDKVLVIAEGETLYYGPREEAQKYMEDLGFEMLGRLFLLDSPSVVADMSCFADGANVADLLVSLIAHRSVTTLTDVSYLPASPV